MNTPLKNPSVEVEGNVISMELTNTEMHQLIELIAKISRITDDHEKTYGTTTEVENILGHAGLRPPRNKEYPC